LSGVYCRLSNVESIRTVFMVSAAGTILPRVSKIIR